MKKIKLTYNIALLAIFIILFISIAAININFFSFDYITAVMLRNIVEIGIIAFPMTIIIITGGIDLSVGSTMILSSVFGGIVASVYGGAAGVIVCFITGALCGFINGLMITKLKISPLVTTLATMYLFMGIARGISKGDSIYSFPQSEFFGRTELFGIPLQIFIYIFFAVLFTVILSKSILGRIVFAIGHNEEAARFSGINVNKVKIAIYTVCGIICAFAALIWLGRFTSVKYDAGAGINLKVVTIVVLGGASILGGAGDMKGTIIATLIIALLNSGLTVLNIPIDTQTIILGSVLVVSLIVFALLNDKTKKARL